ncbi:Bax inhibitor-1/YccA family protein [Pullulanibacillus sp. KACC 23026]|uniref:Bax inhibitor-1/YccA family protein n=1 Tax=Pullulanibacillus sp. KACC 23026 TaxID=3028315 RepID=UPI0023B0F702|nr:Bax inhibitor-1/YccA family protein [Pullulanibacillus sp. KACC 23026]WEG12763.1 Bax inhibitor-1/YccA family protein [Pullulanibacillus sp. KACC 23026]
MDTVIQTRKGSPFAKFYAALFSGLLVATAGLFIGQSIPRGLFLPLAIVEIIMITMMVFARKQKAIGYPLMYVFMLISGATLYPAISYYVSMLGADVVFRAFAITTISFGAMAIFTTVTKRDFSFLGGFLFVSVIALIGLQILNMFIPANGTAQLILSGFGILVFVGYTLYDFSRITRYGFTDSEIPFIVIAIYLDFVNLFLYILQFLGVSNRD